jgi:hypothetical protein
MAEETLLRNDWYHILWQTRYSGENFIPNAGFILLLWAIVLQGKLGENKSQCMFAFVPVPWINRTPISSVVKQQVHNKAGLLEDLRLLAFHHC